MISWLSNTPDSLSNILLHFIGKWFNRYKEEKLKRFIAKEQMPRKAGRKIFWGLLATNL